MLMPWTVPTYASALQASGLALEPNAPVKCPSCGRRTNADMLTDVRAIPPEQRTAWNLGGTEFLCDGCRERAFREGRVTRAEFYAALGAPPEVLERITG